MGEEIQHWKITTDIEGAVSFLSENSNKYS